MTRRAFLFTLSAAASTETSPKDQCAIVANQFNTQYVQWANAFNRVRPGTIDVAEDTAFEPLSRLWRHVENVRRNWIRSTH